MSLLIGADPELFLKKGQQNFSGYNIIPGTKMAPHPVPEGAVQVDGMALEFNINPCATPKEFVYRIETVLASLREMVPADYEFDISPVAHFTEEYMDTQPEDAKRLGCDPDFDAYTGKANNPPPQHPTMRTAAGHVHLGWTTGADVTDPDHFDDCRIMARQMDYYLGLFGVLHDPDNTRRQMYGRPGCFRPKPYGCEYRVLSNFWLKSPELMEKVFTQATRGFNHLIKGQDRDRIYGQGTAAYYITSANKGTAREYLRAIGCGDMV